MSRDNSRQSAGVSRRRLIELGVLGGVSGAIAAILGNAATASAGSGLAYVFLIRNALPFDIGHVAVGIQGQAGGFTYMSKDGPGHTQHGGSRESGFWVRSGSRSDMFGNMQDFGYSEYAFASVTNADTGGASRAATGAIPGYALIGDNCLDLTYQVLKGYGAPGLPSVQDWHYAAPSWWFDTLSSDWTFRGWA